MKAEYIVRQLQAVLPKYTDFFTDKVNISSLTYVGGTVTAVTATDHNLTTGDYVVVNNALEPNPITSIVRTGDIATATTQFEHDLTAAVTETVIISGADQAEYNGVKQLLAVPTATTFEFTVTGDPTTPATGTIFLNEKKAFGYDGRFEVTVINPTTFIYSVAYSLRSSATSVVGTDITALTKARITSAAAFETSFDSYTKNNIDDYYLFVVLGDTNANRDRFIENDASYRVGQGIDYRQILYQTIDIFVYAPTRNSISGRKQRDDMADIRIALFKSLLGARFDTGFTNTEIDGMTFVRDGIEAYDNSKYIHNYEFQVAFTVTQEDTVEPDLNVAFRDFEINYLNDFEENIKEDGGRLP